MARASPAGVHRMDPRRRPGSGHQGLPGARRLRQGGRVHRMVEDITLRRHAKELGLKNAPAQPDGGLPDGILVGPQGRMVSFNKKFVEMGHPGQGGAVPFGRGCAPIRADKLADPGLPREVRHLTNTREIGREISSSRTAESDRRPSPCSARRRPHGRPGSGTSDRKKAEISPRKEEKFRCWRPPRRRHRHDGTRQISHWNPAARRMFGYSEKEAMSRSLHSCLRPRHLAAHRKGFPAWQEHDQRSGKTLESRPAGRTARFPIELSMSSLRLGGCWHAVASPATSPRAGKPGRSSRRARTLPPHRQDLQRGHRLTRSRRRSQRQVLLHARLRAKGTPRHASARDLLPGD